MLPRDKWGDYQDLCQLTVGEYLRLYLFVIPDFQSPYRWSKPEAELFFRKIKDVVDGRYSLIPPSFNLINVYVDSPEEKEKRFIQEGYQRTITMILFICVIRDLLLKYGNGSKEAESLAKALHHDYIYKFYTMNDKDKVYKVEFHKRDSDFVKNVILEPWDSHDRKILREYKKVNNSFKRESCKNMFIVYRYLFNEVELMLNYKTTPLLKLKHLDTILNSFLDKIVLDLKTYIGVGMDYLINSFTEMNQSVVKLHKETEVKGHLLQLCNNVTEQQQVVNLYEKMMDRFNTNTEIETFFNYRSIAYFGKKLTKDAIPRAIIFELRQQNRSAIEFAKELDHVAEIFQAYFKPDERYWKKISIVNTLSSLNIGKFKQACPVVIAARENILALDLLDELFKHVLKVFTIRAIFDFNPNDTLPTMIKACGILRGEGDGKDKKGNIKSESERIALVKEVITKGILPQQRATQKEFLKRIDEPITDNNKSSILLRLIESHVTNEDVLYPTPELVNLEHVIPRKPTKEWDVILNQWNYPTNSGLNSSYNYHIERIGNKALLKQEPNKRFSNTFLYEKKRELYKKSSFRSTKEFKDIDKFDIVEFEKRQKRLITHISDIFQDIFT